MTDLTEPARIVALLAKCGPPLDSEGDYCALCFHARDLGGHSHEHDCPWLLAVNYQASLTT